MSPNQKRYMDTGESIYGFLDHTYVECPHCGKCARTSRIDPESNDLFAPRRLICRYCGAVREWHGHEIKRSWHSSPLDDYFELPLWLRIPCCGKILWAYNLKHLDFIEVYIGATLRERERDPQNGWSNASLASRLPKWMSSGKHRDEILECIRKIREKGL